jgi:hypothetical protein
MPGIEIIRSLLQQASSQGSRSTALNPLGWALAIVLAALIGASPAHLPSWILPFLVVFTCVLIAAYLAAYFFLLVKDRDALRSEKFHLSKMAIERSITGDNLSGFIEPEKPTRSLPAIESKPGDKNNEG